MKTKIIVLSIILLLPLTNVFAQKQSVSAQVDSFYKFYRARSDAFNSGDVNLYKKWFSAGLTKLFQNELKREREFLKKNPTDKPHFGDGFPFIPPDECYKMGKFYKHNYRLGSETIRKGIAVVEVKFYNQKVCGGDFIETYKVELIKSKGGWLINDFIYADGKRLSEDLKRAEY